ncbi:hypothetical protein GPECTOR_522g507 [Gonium pectorale]|uniref:Ankyrin repeat domain-containing protein n=1 Tax=Gonium pectorale TaxID=33097 RepID=A0A150FUU0_GONPE|nr:hypothetical protein GPECTOR_522g507 [Gonium pectorale]|eukprot:KXZ41359.1 hypothetical protein GPECTOR_522g507 [Gonium pectorale]
MLGTPEFTTVRLSEPVPHHAFALRWGRPGALRDLTWPQRHDLLCLTAASGATANLALAVQSDGCPLTVEVGYAAGKAGQPGSCALLAELGCNMWRAVEGAAAGGHLALCEDLLTGGAGGLSSFLSCAFAAAEAGHTHVVEWMVRRYEELELLGPRSWGAWELVKAVAEGCDLAALQRYHAELIAPEGAEEEDQEVSLESVQWLESQGFPHTWEAFTAAAKRPDALERLTWLAQRGYPRRPERGYGANAPLVAAAATGNAAAVLFLAEGLPVDEDFGDVWCTAAAKGHLPVLQALHAAGRCVGAHAAHAATRNGHLHVLAWLLKTPDLGVALNEKDDGRICVDAVQEGDFTVLECLLRLGCPWDPTGHVSNACLKACNMSQVDEMLSWLSWLVAAGCPIDWPVTVVIKAAAAVAQAAD